MKRTFTQQPVIPEGYTGKNFNSWSKYIHKQLEKTVYNTTTPISLYQRIINSI